MEQWQYQPPLGINAPSGAGTGGAAPFARDELDMRRMAQRGANRTPGAMYPDGYLGTIRSRRDDRLLDSLKARQNQRAYQRGVHKGERIDPHDYYWPDRLGPDSGVRRQIATASLDEHGSTATLRHAPSGEHPIMLTNDGKPAPRGSQSLLLLDRDRAEALKRLGPTWS
jgi:hypothetical protein